MKDITVLNCVTQISVIYVEHHRTKKKKMSNAPVYKINIHQFLKVLFIDFFSKSIRGM